jgi:hypothetical protein
MYFMDNRLQWDNIICGYRAFGPRCEVVAKRHAGDNNGEVVATLYIRDGGDVAFETQSEAYSDALEALREVVGRPNLLPVHVAQWFFGSDAGQDIVPADPEAVDLGHLSLEARVTALEETLARLTNALKGKE